jgi:2-polyprenyl-6-methoxyphenol hydroxylase-like FAD-dependent oxidoreductase
MVPGALERILPKSSMLKTLSIYAYGRHLAHVPNDRYDSPYPAAVLNGQDVIEGALWEELAANDRPVFSETTFVDAQQHADYVAVDVDHQGSRRTVRARYVVGCDSGNSLVRKAAGLTVEPETLEGIHFLLMDATLHWNRPTDRDRMWMFFYDNGYYGIAPCYGGHHHLWSFELVDQPLRRDPTVQEMTDRLKDVTGDPSVSLSNIIWKSHITEPRTGVAPALQSGRFFLAGDAGHIALPVGGKGMNSGIQDALALGWRLAAVLQDQAKEALLNTYNEERLVVRQELKKYQLKGLYDLVDPGTMQKLGMKYLGPLLTKTLGATGAAEFQGQKDPAMLKLAYPNGTLVADELAHSGIKAGSRAPDATLAGPGGEGVQLHTLFYGSTQWTALLFDGKGDYETGKETLHLQQSLQDLSCVRAYAVIGGAYTQRASLASTNSNKQAPSLLYDLDNFAHKAYDLSDPALVLVRPDGYIGYRGPLQDEGIRQFLGQVMS